ncbi:hypothetical protein FNJ84_16760 [Paracoccus sp. M683]|uniref:hypothetical protein n=1 Tax=Paracoccus sp. M683 TaxID=2594268 RepID=UPI00117F2B9C|nr:hypothetical protein [Paracoccus sp. M683]TRW95372.1 hypothetical protein FNJ84_16760 [Paracoccus sp. M683]
MARIAYLGTAAAAAIAAFIAFAAVSQDSSMTPITPEIQVAYPDAPSALQQVAAAIRAGQPPAPADLAALDTAAIDAPYIGTDNQRRYLLNDTLLYRNFPAAEALVAAGADVNYADNIMVFNALDMSQGREAVPFVDYSPGIPFLRLYLENGGDPNAQFMRDQSGNLPLNHQNDNLEGVLMLLEHGADPWLQAPTPQGTKARSFYDSIAFSASGIVAGEMLFRIADAGHFAGQPVDKVQIVYDIFERSLLDKQGSTRRADLHASWRRKTILAAIIETSGWAPPPRLQALLETPTPDAYGGWHLRPDQLHSGPEFTGPTITDGTLIWTHADRTPRPRPAE